MVGINADAGAERIEMVAVHHHICQSLTKHLVLAFVGCGKAVILDMYRGIDKCAEAAQDNLHSLPYVLLLRDAVGVSYFCLLNGRSRNLDVIDTEGGDIAQNERSLAEHQQSGVSE